MQAKKQRKMEYYISIKNEKRGPYTLNELKERNLDATTLVMPTNGETWIPAWQVDELRPLLEATIAENTARESSSTEDTTSQQVIGEPLQTIEAEAIQQEEIPFVKAKPVYNGNRSSAYEAPYNAPKKKQTHGCLISLVVLVVMILLLCFTCPTKDDHKQALANVVTQTMNDATNQIDKTSSFGDIGQAFATMLLSTIERTIQSSIDHLLQVDNYGICSIGKINIDGQEKIISVGILTHVFTIDKQDIEQEISKRVQGETDIQTDDKIKQMIKGLINSI